MSDERYDVAVVGASIGGCTAARLFARRGARVALIERRPDPDAHKTVCTHYIQSSATPTIERLGLAPLLDGQGAIHNSIDLWTRHSGWIGAPAGGASRLQRHPAAPRPDPAPAGGRDAGRRPALRLDRDRAARRRTSRWAHDRKPRREGAAGRRAPDRRRRRPRLPAR